MKNRLLNLVWLIVFSYPLTAQAQLQMGDVVVTDQFLDVAQVFTAEGSIQDLYGNLPLFTPIPQRIAVIDGVVFCNAFESIYRFDPSGTEAELLTEFGDMREMIVDVTTGDLVIANPLALWWVDSNTGEIVREFSPGLFSAEDVIQDSNGDLIVIDLFSGIFRLTPEGEYTEIGDFGAGSFKQLTMGLDGMLYASENIPGKGFGDFLFQVNPETGEVKQTPLPSICTIEDLATAPDGKILVCGKRPGVNGDRGVAFYDPATEEYGTVFSESTLGNPSINPNGIEVVRSPGKVNPGDVNLDGQVTLLDVAGFIDRLSMGIYQPNADINADGVVDLLDVGPFTDLLAGD